MNLAILRLVLVCHSVVALAQAVFAGQFLSGVDRSVKFHEWTGWTALVICGIQIIVASLLLRSNTISLWLVLGSVLLLLSEALQIGTGYARFLDVHVPLGAIVLAVVSWQTISVIFKAIPSNGAPK